MRYTQFPGVWGPKGVRGGVVNVKVTQYKERKVEGRERILRGKGAIGGGSLMGAIGICDAEPGERKVKKPRGGKKIK